MLAIGLSAVLTLVLYIQLKRVLRRSLIKVKDGHMSIQNQYDKLLQENTSIKQYIFDLEKSASDIIALYDITKEICKSLELSEVFTAFKAQLNKYIDTDDCLLLKADADLSAYSAYTVLPLNINSGVMGYLAANIKKEDKEKFNILYQQFILGAKRTLLYKKVQEMAISDSLTQAFSRRYCLERFDEEIERSKRFNYNFSLLMLDIDHFKNYNDSYGHLVGDAILREVSKTIKENIRQIDLIGRYGGEEFMVILTETDKKEAEFAAERIRQAAESRQIKVYDENLKVTISIGICAFPIDGKDTQELISKADSALYRAKQAGRNKVCLS